jgi:SAM-dependent methyltransferase
MSESAASAATVSAWEAAYLRFETPEEEIRKFSRRLRAVHAAQWPRESRIVELFCGRGNGLVALERLGFSRLDGVDLSPRLVTQYRGAAACHVADCRQLPFDARSKDIAIVQGGLHHLNVLPDDLLRVLAEVHRILRPGGKFFAVEPWETPFLQLVHRMCGIALLRRVWPRLDALATMIEHERTTYEQWLSRAKEILECIERYFEPQQRCTRWGKLVFLGTRRSIDCPMPPSRMGEALKR